VRHYSIHTDADKEAIKRELKDKVKWGKGSVFHVYSKSDMSTHHAMQQMFYADVLIPAYSAMSISMALLSRGIVLYPRRKKLPHELREEHCDLSFFACPFMYGPPFDDEFNNSWPMALGNWYGVGSYDW
jgi:hypothetical protein